MIENEGISNEGLSYEATKLREGLVCQSWMQFLSERKIVYNNHGTPLDITLEYLEELVEDFKEEKSIQEIKNYSLFESFLKKIKSDLEFSVETQEEMRKEK